MVDLSPTIQVITLNVNHDEILKLRKDNKTDFFLAALY